MQDEDNTEIYIASFYSVIMTLTTIGYGDIVASNSMERVVGVLVMLGGILFYSYTIGTVTSLMSASDRKASKTYSKVAVLNDIARNFGLSRKLVSKLKTALEYGQVQTRKERDKVLAALPKKLSNQLYLIMHQDLITNNSYFKDRPLAFIILVVKYLRPLKLRAKEYLYHRGEFSEEMFFVVTGEITVYHLVTAHTTMGPDTFFGDMELFLSETRQTTARALKDSQLLTLSKEDFFSQVLQHFEQLRVELILGAHQQRRRHAAPRRNLTVPLRPAQCASYIKLRKTLPPSTRVRLDGEGNRLQLYELKDEVRALRVLVQDLQSKMLHK